MPFVNNVEMNTKQIGTYAVSLCTTYFLAKGFHVLYSLGDVGHYDLVVEKEGVFQRVQCKMTRSVKKPQQYPRVSLRVSGALKKTDGGVARYTIHDYTSEDFDLLWVTTPHACYLIPFSDVLQNRKSKSDLKLYPKWDKYRVAIPIPYPSGEESPIRRSSPRLTNDDKALIKRLRKEGKTQKEIADILGVTRACISKFLTRKVNES